MTEKLQIYKCEICGNLIQVLLKGADALVCCGEPMKLQEIKHQEDEFGEKHNPKIEYKDNKRFVNVIGHPMVDEHFIQLIQTYTKDKNEVYLKYFYPNQTPEMEITLMPEEVDAIEYCNIHRLWGNTKQK